MQDGMSYDPIQGQGQGHGICEVPKIALFQLYLLRHLQRHLANDHYFLNYSTISKFLRAGFSIFFLVFVSRDLELGAVPAEKKFFSDFNEIWYVDRGRSVMHDHMPYDPIQGQGNE